MNRTDFKYKHLIVDKLLKKSTAEKTEKTYVIEDDGSRSGPYLRKVFRRGYGLGEAYKILGSQQFRVNNCNNLPKIYSVYNDEDHLIIFEEYIEGKTLSDYIAQYQYDDKIVWKLYSQLCKAVKFLHQNLSEPVIHRDIKPENIMVTKSGDVKLIDFGISRKFKQEKNNDTFKFGTVGYASPEHFGYQQTDARSDIFSMGKVLEFLSNQENWKEKSDGEVADFSSVIKKACEIDPIHRYQTVDELQKDFEVAVNGGSFFEKLTRNKVLLVLGHIWNVLLIITIICMIVLSIGSLFYTDSFGDIKTGQRIIYAIILVLFIWLPLFAVLTYKPSWRKIVKKTPKLKLWQYIIFIFCCVSIIMFLSIIAQIIK